MLCVFYYILTEEEYNTGLVINPLLKVRRLEFPLEQVSQLLYLI